MSFDHAVHAKADVSCESCHRGAATETWAGLPTVQDCLACHSMGEAYHEGISRLRAMAETGTPARWANLYELAPHARFSHRAHAKTVCSKCHGSAGREARLTRADALEGEDRMAWCVDCHDSRKAATDCLTCHL